MPDSDKRYDYDDVFYDHVARHANSNLDDIACTDCPVTARAIGIKIRYFRMIYCDKCNLYMCSKCRFGSPDETQTDQGFTHSSACDYPASFIT